MPKEFRNNEPSQRRLVPVFLPERIEPLDLDSILRHCDLRFALDAYRDAEQKRVA